MLGSKIGLEDLTNRARAKVTQLEEVVKQNPANLKETVEIPFLNEWLLESIRKSTL